MMLRKQHNYSQPSFHCLGLDNGQYRNKFAQIDAQGIRVCDNYQFTQQLPYYNTFLI